MKKRLTGLLLFACLVLSGCSPAAAPSSVPAKQEEPPVAAPANAPEAAASKKQEELPQAQSEAETPEEEEAVEQDENPVPALEERIDEYSPVLTALHIDGGYTLEFRPELRTYELHIPAGRPRVPRLTAEAAEGEAVRINQACIPDNKSWGLASVTVTDANGAAGKYEVLFVKDSEKGFQLQYLDCWQFEIDAQNGDGVEYRSSNPQVLSVDADGRITANMVCGEAVTVEALANGTVIDSLTVDSVVDAVVNICIITGQSNASGTLDIPYGFTEAEFIEKEKKDTLCPEPGTAFCLDISWIGEPERRFYDLSAGRIGFSPALAKTWYDLTGEKTVVLQTAVGGSPIVTWMKPEDGVRYAYINQKSNLYETTTAGYQLLMQTLGAENSGFEISKTFAYWLQGETESASTFNVNKVAPGVGDYDWGSKEHILSSQEYYDIFCKNMEYFRDELNVDFMGILLVRNLHEVCSLESLALQLLTDLTPIRAAQYALNNDTVSDVGLVSRVCDIARKDTYKDSSVEGWGWMGCNDVHYNQEGHNANGIAAAENTFGFIYGGETRKATDVEWIKKNGRDRFADGETLTLKEGEAYQTAAMVLPMYTDTRTVIYTSEDATVCTVDQFGLITAVGQPGKTTTVTITCPDTDLSKTITVTIKS